jgi:predicted dehydrogenase
MSPDNPTSRIRLAVIGTGGMARWHLQTILKQQATTEVVALCEPAAGAYQAAAELFTQAGLTPPPQRLSVDEVIALDQPDAALIVTPHVYHFPQATAFLTAGVDVLLEKPMTMNAAEARELIAVRDRTGRLLSVAFNGSFSPQIRTAAGLLREGKLGDLIAISAEVWQEWGAMTRGTWRQDFAVSGGGFLFDTGAHMLNTVADLAGQNVIGVSALVDYRGYPVETVSAVVARLESGAMVTLTGVGDTPPGIVGSRVRVYGTQGVIETGIWGERLMLQRAGRKRLQAVKVPASLGVWEQFVQVRAGLTPNPCPPEIGLRMISFYDAIVASGQQNGAWIAI